MLVTAAVALCYAAWIAWEMKNAPTADDDGRIVQDAE